MSFKCLEHFRWTVWNYLMLYALGAWYLVQELVLPHKKPTGICNQNERVAVVTGGGRGIGLEAVKQFLSLDMTVVIGGRNVSLMEKAIAELRSSGISGGRAECLELDLKSLDSVRKFASQFLKLNLPLHLLVNNAGIMFWPEETTEDGYESHWSVNYLGHFLLTHLLYPVLKTSSSPKNPSRVVNLTSSVHYIGSINFDDIASNQERNSTLLNGYLLHLEPQYLEDFTPEVPPWRFVVF